MALVERAASLKARLVTTEKDYVRLPRDALVALVDELAAEGAIVRDGRGVRLAAHQVRFSGADAALWNGALPMLEKSALRPPPLAELAGALKSDARKL